MIVIVYYDWLFGVLGLLSYGVVVSVGVFDGVYYLMLVFVLIVLIVVIIIFVILHQIDIEQFILVQCSYRDIVCLLIYVYIYNWIA